MAEQRLIDANSLWIALEDTGADIHEDWADGYSEWGFSWEAIEKVLQNAPTVDAVEVVRCKDCKHFGKCSIYDIGNFNRYDFCSYGERRTDG